MYQVKIAPSILAGDYAKMGDAVRLLGENGADMVHCDVMDGNFVPPITFGAQMVKSIRPYTNLPLDCHLMVANPEKQIELFAAAGADVISVHVEACRGALLKTMKRIRELGVKAAAVVNPATAIEEIFPAVEFADMLLVMSVVPGWGGQKFIPESLKKIETLREFCLKNGKGELYIEVDGGINEENVKSVISAGANVIVAGSAVFRSENMAETIARLRGV